MPDESDVKAGKRFAHDLSRIREDRGLSVEAIHEETRIAETLIRSFEEGGLYDHPTFNRVYLRSFVRAYAEALDLSPEAAISALESALDGSYEHDLAEEHLGSAPSEASTQKDEGESSPDPSESDTPDRSTTTQRGDRPPAGGPEGRGGIVGPPRALDVDEDEDSDEHESPPQETESGTADSGSDDTETDQGLEADAASEAQEETESEDDVTDEGDPESPEQHEPVSEQEEKDQQAAPEASDYADEERREEENDNESDAEESGEGTPGQPDWMDEEAEEEVSADSGGGIEPPDGVTTEQPTGDPAGGAVARDGEGGMGIVGEPTALGEPSDGSERMAEPDGLSGAAPGPSAQSSSAGWLDGARRNLVLTGVGILALVIILGGLGITYFSSGQSAETAESAPPSDTTATADPDSTQTSTPERPPLANLSLGSTLHLTVRAEADVGGIRIQRDDDLRRPYWIEEGEAEVYPFSSRIIIEDQLENVVLYLEGYRYPTSRQSDGEITITRDTAEAFADTLRGAPRTLAVPSDTIPVGQPAGAQPPADTTATTSS